MDRYKLSALIGTVIMGIGSFMGKCAFGCKYPDYDIWIFQVAAIGMD